MSSHWQPNYRLPFNDDVQCNKLGGTALISSAGKLIGIGSLQLECARGQELNMVVPIDLLYPILDDLRSAEAIQ